MHHAYSLAKMAWCGVHSYSALIKNNIHLQVSCYWQKNINIATNN